ncbi:hypothetical protein FMUND_15311 [Fusarium mundagurra]|uniref:Uncharacterized protein n=1 Tax=Fusarium mundagurra TaxID=1567541 RepID=A0A8H6CYJ7_9HYPO|nr:hypothetical protein FMUND_15311 [Fusarium mundagurra]
MGIIATFVGHGKHMRTNLIAPGKETETEAWNKVLEHKLVFYAPSSAASIIAGAILIHRPKGMDACRWEIQLLALAPQTEDGVAHGLLNRVQTELCALGSRTLVATALVGGEEHFLAPGFTKTVVPEYKLDGNSAPGDVSIMYKIVDSKS